MTEKDSVYPYTENGEIVTRFTEDDYGVHGSGVERYLDSVHGDVSRTFELALGQLEDGELRHSVRDSYLLCRIADTIEDTSRISGEDKAELLESYSELVQNPGYREAAEWVREVSEGLEDSDIGELSLKEVEGDEEAYWSLVRNSHAVFSSYEEKKYDAENAVAGKIQEMAEGMAEYVRDGDIRLRDEGDLKNYCHIVAGTVGEFLTHLFSSEAEEVDEKVLTDNAEDYAQLLQRINIAKDPVDDFRQENAIFIPETFMEMSHEELKKQLEQAVESDSIVEDYGEFVEAVENVLGSAREKADSATTYVTEFDGEKGIRAYLETPLLLALATDHWTEPEDAFTESGMKIDQKELYAVIKRAGNIEDEEWNDTEELLDSIHRQI